MMQSKPANKKESSQNAYGSVLAISLGLIALDYMYDIKYLQEIGLVLGGISLFIAPVRNAVHFLWTKLSKLLSKFMPLVILTLMYYLVVTPLGVLSRIFQKSDPLKFKNKMESVFDSSQRKVDKKFFEKTW